MRRTWSYARHFSPATSLVPDSQSPEPAARRHPSEEDGNGDRDVQPWASTSARSQWPSLARGFKYSLLNKSDTDESTFGTESSVSRRSQQARSRSPSAIDPRDRYKLETGSVTEEAELTAAARRELFGSRVNDERRHPKRRRERAPSYDWPVKRQAEDGLPQPTGISNDRSTCRRQSQPTESSAADFESPNIALTEQSIRDRSSSSWSPSPSSSNSSAGGSEQRSAFRSTLFLPEDTDDSALSDEGTPFVPQQSTIRGPVSHRSNSRGPDAVTRVKSESNRRRKPTKTQVEREASNFLESLRLPMPVFRPLSVKQRLTNRLAESTDALPCHARIERVVPPPDLNPLRAGECASGSPTVSDHVHTHVCASHMPTASGTVAAEAAGPDSLPDFEEGNPEAVPASRSDQELRGEQGYFRRPNKQGAIQRWIVMLDRDKRSLPPPYDIDILLNDRKFLGSIPLRLPPSVTTFAPAGDFAEAPAQVLLRTAPSHETCAALWEDLLSPEHPTRHALANRHSEPPRGRACRCPVWVPHDRPRDWSIERDRLAGEGLCVEALVRASEAVFDLATQPVAAELKEDARRAESLIQLLHTYNWLWYDQLVEFARVACHFAALASPSLVQDLSTHLAYAKGRFTVEQRLVVQRYEDDKLRAKAEGRLVDKELWQAVLMVEDQWRVEQRDIVERLERLKAHLPAG